MSGQGHRDSGAKISDGTAIAATTDRTSSEYEAVHMVTSK